MTSLLKSLRGNGSKDRELSEELQAVLNEMRQERGRHEALLKSLHDAAERLEQLGGPITKATGDVDGLTQRLAEVEQRLASVNEVAQHVTVLEQRTEGLDQRHQDAKSQIAGTLEEAQRIRAAFEDIGHKVDTAVALKERLESFLEVERPFQEIRGEGDALRAQVESTAEQLTRMREQNDRLMDAHKLAMTKMEALDRRRDDLGRELQDKERRVATVEKAVYGMDGIQNTVDEVKREIGTLKALGDSVVQKTAALEAQRDAVDRALAQAEHLERAMRQIDSGIRQQQDNEKALSSLQDQVSGLRSLHESVLERSTEISQLQRETEEQMRLTRQDLASVTDEMKKTVERFDFESRGLESFSQRVADLRGELSDCENRFKALNEPSLAVGEIRTRAKSLAAHLQSLSDDVGRVDQEMATFQTIRRDLDQTGRSVSEVAAQLAQIEASRPAIEAALRDLERMNGAHTMVKDAVDQAQFAHGEIARMRESQSDTRTWLLSVERFVSELRDRVGELHRLAPTIAVVQEHAQRLGESMTTIETRREFVETLHQRMGELATLGGTLDEQGKALEVRMEAAEQRFTGLVTHAEETDRLRLDVAAVASSVNDAARKAEEIVSAVAAISARCESVEQLADKTRALKPELEQRHQALREASKELQRASGLRKEAASNAHKLDELVKQIATSLTTADERYGRAQALASELDRRVSGLGAVEKRLARFEERITEWDPVEKQIARSLELITTRQGTVESLQADLDRMFAMAEKTASEVREITSAQQEVEQSRRLLAEVLDRIQEVKETANALDERKRQLNKAEERLARAEALLSDVGSSIETLQGQKAIVDQAVEKAGSLQFLLKRAEATIEGLREEREVTARVRTAVAAGREDDGDADDEAQAA